MDISDLKLDFSFKIDHASITDILDVPVTIKKIVAKKSRYEGEVPFYFIIYYVLKNSKEKILRSFTTGSQVIGHQITQIYQKIKDKKFPQEPFTFDLDMDCVFIEYKGIKTFFKMVSEKDLEKEKVENNGSKNIG